MQILMLGNSVQVDVFIGLFFFTHLHGKLSMLSQCTKLEGS